jgi:PAS domain S-box-containing protein
VAVLSADDPVFTVLAASDSYFQSQGLEREQVVGRGIFEHAGNALGLGASLCRALRNKVPDRIAYALNTPVLAEDGSVEYLLHSVTQPEENSFLFELDDATRDLTDPDEILSSTARSLGEYLGVDRCAYCHFEPGQDSFRVSTQYSRPGVEPLSGRYLLSDFGPVVSEMLLANQPYVAERIDDNPDAADAGAPYRKAGVVALILVPINKAGRLAAAMGIHHYTARKWMRSEVELVRAAANRCWESIERVRVASALRASEERLRLAQRAGRIGSFDWYIKERRSISSPEMEALYGLPEGTFQEGFAEFAKRVVSEDAERVIAELQKRMARREPEAVYEFRALLPDGSTRWLRGHAKLFYDNDGGAERMIGVNIDIDAQRKAEIQLRQSESRLRAIVDGTQEYIGLLTPDGKLLDANRASLEFAGNTREEVLGRYFWDTPWFTGTPGASETVKDSISRVARGETVRVEKSLRRPNGEWRDFHSSYHPIKNESGEIVLIVPEALDVTDRTQAEERSRQQWHLFDTALSNTSDHNYIFDLQGRFLYANRSLLTMWDRPLNEAIGKSLLEMGYPPHLAERFEGQIQQVIETKQPLRDNAFVSRIGRDRHYEYIFVPVLSDDGTVEAVAGSTRDVTDQKLAEKQLRLASERLEAALNAAEMGIWTWDIPEDRVIGDSNMLRLFGLAEAAASEGVPIASYLKAVHCDDLAAVSQALVKTLAEGGRYETEFRLSVGGSLRWVVAQGRVKADGANQPQSLNGVVLDITERRQAEQRLRESESRFRQLIDSMPQLVWSAAADGYHDLYNKQWFSYSGLSYEEAAGEGSAIIHPDDLAAATERWRHSLATGEPYEIEYRCRRYDGEYRWFLGRAAPMLDDMGRVIRWLGTSTDIHEQKENERKLRQAHAELEEFSYVASHDLQEPLRMVNIYTQLLLKNMGALDEVREQYATYVRQGVKRMDLLLQDLLTFSRVVHMEDAEGGTADLGLVLEDALSVLRSRIDESGAAIVRGALPCVRGDADQLTHVFQNILSNALKYSRKDPRPEIKIEAQPEGDDWVVSVADNGIGFEPQYADRIFGLFKRLHKDEYPGTGLGLAICKRILARYGGSIRAEGRPGHGAKFFVSLPKAGTQP